MLIDLSVISVKNEIIMYMELLYSPNTQPPSGIPSKGNIVIDVEFIQPKNTMYRFILNVLTYFVFY